MRFESSFYNTKLNKKHEKYQLTLAGFFALLAFGLIAGLHKDENYHSNSRRLARIIGHAINGLKNMDIGDVIMAGLTALIIGFITIFILDTMFQNRQIIVAFEMDQPNEMVIFDTKTYGNEQTKQNKVKFDDISFSSRKLKDGINNEVFDCLEFKKNLQPIGILYLNHPMWSMIDPNEFEKSINNLKNRIR